MSSSMTPARANQILHDGTVILQAEITSNDVLLGRGAPLLTFQGNVLFRKTVQDRYEDYLNAHQQSERDEVAREVTSIIRGRGGRFLRKLDSAKSQQKNEGLLRVVENDETAWTAVEDNTILRKVKQAFRDLKKNDPDSNDDSFDAAPNDDTGAPLAKTVQQVHQVCSSQQEALKKKHIWASTTHSLSSSLDKLQSHVRLMEQLQQERQIIASSQTYAPPLSTLNILLESHLQQEKQRIAKQLVALSSSSSPDLSSTTSEIARAVDHDAATSVYYRLVAMGKDRPQNVHHSEHIPSYCSTLGSVPKCDDLLDQSLLRVHSHCQKLPCDQQSTFLKQLLLRDEVLALAQQHHKVSDLVLAQGRGPHGLSCYSRKRPAHIAFSCSL